MDTIVLQDRNTTPIPESVRTYFEHALGEGKLAHAYLFTGASGNGQEETLQMIASAFGIAAHHPDFKRYEPASSKGYLIDQVKGIIEDTNLSPVRSALKLYVIKDADKLTDLTANALLKTLEEPPESTVFILLAQDTSQVLPTIVSRTQIVPFYQARRSEASDASDDAHKDERIAHEITQDSARVEFYLSPEGEDLREARSKLTQALVKITAYDDKALLDLVQVLLNLVLQDEEVESNEIERMYLSAKALKEQQAQKKRQQKQAGDTAIRELIYAAKSLVHDMLVIGSGEETINYDIIEQIEQATPCKAERLSNAVQEALDYLGQGVSTQLVLESFLISWKRTMLTA